MNKGIKVLIAAAIVVLAAVIAVVVGKSFTGGEGRYEEAFYPGTTLNGIDISELSVDGAKEKLTGLSADYNLDIALKDSKISLSAADMKMTLGSSVDLQALKDAQNAVPFKETAAEALALTADDLFTCDTDAIRTALEKDSAFDLTVKGALPTQSKLSYDADASKFVLVDGKPGTGLDIDAVTEAAKAAAEGLQPEIDAEEMDLHMKPAVTSDSDKASDVLKKANSLLDLGISYTFADGETEKISKTFVSEIVYLDENGQIQVDNDRVQSLVNKYVEDHSNGSRILDFQTTGGGEIELSVPAEGESIDATALYEDILKCFADGKGGERDVPYAQNDGDISSDFGGNYIEIDLDNQVLYFYQDGELQMTSDIVSGSVYLTHMTPTGVFQIYSMETNVVLKGPGYESPVTFWMPFTGSIGMHDASWRWQFGGDDYLYDGSHGCINMPYDNAAFVYEHADIGYYVIVYGGEQYVDGQHIEIVSEETDKPKNDDEDDDEDDDKKKDETKKTTEKKDDETKATKATEATKATKATEPATKATEPTTKATEPQTKATEPATKAPEPTPTEAPEPTPTEAPEPTPTEAPEPTPTEAPEPTPTEAPAPDNGEGEGGN